MIEIDDALCAAMAADSPLVAILGGSAAAISAQWPDAEAKFSSVPPNVTDYSALGAIDPPRGRVTVVLVSPDEDPEIPSHQDEYQIDIWSRSARLNAAVARRVKQILDRGGLAPAGDFTITETYCTYGPDLFESDTRIHHKVLSYHVTWNGPA